MAERMKSVRTTVLESGRTGRQGSPPNQGAAPFTQAPGKAEWGPGGDASPPPAAPVSRETHEVVGAFDTVDTESSNVFAMRLSLRRLGLIGLAVLDAAAEDSLDYSAAIDYYKPMLEGLSRGFFKQLRTEDD